MRIIHTPAAVFPFPPLLLEASCGAESEPRKNFPVEVTAALTRRLIVSIGLKDAKTGWKVSVRVWVLEISGSLLSASRSDGSLATGSKIEVVSHDMSRC